MPDVERWKRKAVPASMRWLADGQDNGRGETILFFIIVAVVVTEIDESGATADQSSPVEHSAAAAIAAAEPDA